MKFTKTFNFLNSTHEEARLKENLFEKLNIMHKPRNLIKIL